MGRHIPSGLALGKSEAVCQQGKEAEEEVVVAVEHLPKRDQSDQKKVVEVEVVGVILHHSRVPQQRLKRAVAAAEEGVVAQC